MIGRYEQLVARAPEGILVHDGERILEVNAAMLPLAGATRREQLLGQPVARLLAHPYLRAVEESLRATPTPRPVPQMVRDQLYRVDGGVREVEVRTQLFLERGVPHAHVMLYDVTDRVAAERALRVHAEPLEADEMMERIRTLAGGVAHEINNMLQIVIGFADVLAQQPLSREQHADVTEIAHAAVRGAAITRQLLQYARQWQSLPRVVDLGETVQRVVAALPTTLTGASLHLIELAPPAGAVRLDPSNLRQMLEHLVENARWATRARGEVTIGVRGVVTTAPRTTPTGSIIPAGAYGTVSVRDSGAGMTPELQGRIFEPFFSTRGQGDGVGLGLPAVQGLVAQNGGFVTCESAPEMGTEFTLWFPVVEPAA